MNRPLQSGSAISARLIRSDARHSYVALSHFFRNKAAAASTVQDRSATQLPARRAQGTRSFSSNVRLRYTAVPEGKGPVDKSDHHERSDTPDKPSASSSTSNSPSNSGEARQTPRPEVLAHVSSFPKSLRQLAESLPSSGFRRPTKEELLAGTSNFFERLRIRFKWVTIRGFRRFRADDWSAFVSWILGGAAIWVIVGTTSFFSALFLILKPLQMQEWIATQLGSYLTSASGVTIIFESAIVPRFSLRDSKLTFKNVFVSRGRGDESAPHQDSTSAQEGERRRKRRVRKESSQALADLRQRESARATKSPPVTGERAIVDPHDDQTATQYTHFDVVIDSVEVTLSLPRWLDGKGLVKDAFVRGVRGVIDRSHIQYVQPDAPVDHTRFRHKSKPGDFHLEHFKVEDFLVTVYQPDDFRPYTFSIFSATIHNLRKQWLFFDLLSAENITGQVDNCLFSLHRPQSIGRTSDGDARDTAWKRMSRFRIDGLPIDHLQSSRDSGPLSWIDSGRADLVADIRFPREPDDDVDLNTILGDIVDNLDEALRSPGQADTAPGSDRIPGRPGLAKGKPLEAPSVSLRHALGLQADTEANSIRRVVSMDLDIRFKELKATVPLFGSDLSSVNNALVRPIVAFINSNKTLIPIRCHLDIDLEEFDGSWTTYDIGLLEAVSTQVYDALALHVQESNARRARTVGLWSLQKSAATILTALKANLEHY